MRRLFAAAVIAGALSAPVPAAAACTTTVTGPWPKTVTLCARTSWYPLRYRVVHVRVLTFNDAFSLLGYRFGPNILPPIQYGKNLIPGQGDQRTLARSCKP